MQKTFKNRTQAGMLLARGLMLYAHRPDVIVLALPRGGVPLGFMVALYWRVSWGCPSI